VFATALVAAAGANLAGYPAFQDMRARVGVFGREVRMRFAG